MFASLEQIRRLYVRWQILAVCAIFIPVLLWLGGLSMYFTFTGSSYTDITSNWQKISFLIPLGILIYLFKLLAGWLQGGSIACPECGKRIFSGQRPEVAVAAGVCPYCNFNLLDPVGEDDG